MKLVLRCSLLVAVAWGALQAAPTTGPAAEALKAIRAGRWEAAEAALRGQDLQDPLGLRLSMEILQRRGDYAAARQTAVRLLEAYRRGNFQTPQDLQQAAFAAWTAQEWEAANDIFLAASENESAPLSLFVDWGHLYLEKFNPGEAEGIFRDALKAPAGGAAERWDLSDARLGLAKALDAQGKPGSSELVQAAMQDNPRNPAVLAHRAADALADENYDEAAKIVAEGLEAAPQDPALLELVAGIAYCREDKAAFDAAVQQVLALNPRDGSLFESLGDLAVSRRRLEEAVQFYDRAFELNPRLWSALASRGINQLRLGQEKEGIEALERSYEADPYNIWAVNTLRLVDSFSRFKRFEIDRFAVRLHEDEADVLRPYVEALLERSLKALESRYQFSIDQTISFEMYPDHEDFAVRTLGLPGLGALGATLGRVVAMDSPNARPKGEFHWGATLWHEMAHVVTLAMSRDRIPRWFTEGLSMMEERLAGPGWGDPISLHFISAYVDGKLLPISKLNSGFLRPETPQQIAVSYLQAGRLCEFLAATFGMDKIRAMVVAYGEGKETEAVFKEVLGKTPDEIDQIFHQDLAGELEPYRKSMARVEVPGQGEEGLRTAIAASPGNFYLNLGLGTYLLEQKRPDEAEGFLVKAKEIFPFALDERGPYAQLFKVYEARKDEEAQRRLLQEWWERSPLMVENAAKLARLLESAGKSEQAQQVLDGALYANPFSEVLHQELAERYLDDKDYARAIREFRVWLALQPTDEAMVRYRLAEALFAAGSVTEARREILRSLEIAPGYEEAQALLLRIAMP